MTALTPPAVAAELQRLLAHAHAPYSNVRVAAAVETARRLGPGHRIVTVLCDSGDRYRSRLYDQAWLTSKGLAMPRKPEPEPGL